jgi:hypothetical protein
MSSRKKILHLCVCKAAVDPPPQIKLTKTHMLLQQKLQQQQQQLLQPHLISSSSSSAAELYLQKTANMQSSAGLKHDRKLNHKPGLQRERERERERGEEKRFITQKRDRERETEEGKERGE